MKLTNPQQRVMDQLAESLEQKIVYCREAFGGRMKAAAWIDREKISLKVFWSLAKLGKIKCVKEEAFREEWVEEI